MLPSSIDPDILWMMMVSDFVLVVHIVCLNLAPMALYTNPFLHFSDLYLFATVLLIPSKESIGNEKNIETAFQSRCSIITELIFCPPIVKSENVSKHVPLPFVSTLHGLAIG